MAHKQSLYKERSILQEIAKYHFPVVITLVLLGVGFAVLSVNDIIGSSTSNENKSTFVDFDIETLDRVDALKKSQDTIDNQQYVNRIIEDAKTKRYNPFVGY